MKKAQKLHLKRAELSTVTTGCQYRAAMVALPVFESCYSSFSSCAEGAQSPVPVRLCQCIISWPAISSTYRCEAVTRCQKQEHLASAGASPSTARPMFGLPFLKAVSHSLRFPRDQTPFLLCAFSWRPKLKADTTCSPFVDAAVFRCGIYRSSCQF